MPSTRETRIGTEVDFERAGKQTGFLRLPYSVHRSAYGWLPVPIVCIKNGRGPRVLLMSGTHGDEFEGQVIVSKLCRELKPSDVRGRIIILPAANLPAVRVGRRTSPLDPGGEGNLNRAFPGDPSGSPTPMIAHYIESVLLPMSDYVFDLHSGGSSLMYLPCAMVPRPKDPGIAKRAAEILRVFGAPISYYSTGSFGDPRLLEAAAARCGVVCMSSELGGGGTVSVAAVAIGDRGIRRVLRHVGALRASYPVATAPKTRFMEMRNKDYFVYASDDGVFEPFVDLGAVVKKGRPAGAIHFAETPWREPTVVKFRHAGMVICKRMQGRAERGDCLFHVATDCEA